jgi:replicative DNA helicase
MKKRHEKPIELNDTIKMPNLPELEEVVLGSVLLESEVLYKISSDFQESLFSLEANKIVCRSIIDLWKQGRPVDIMTVTQHLHSNSNLSKVGGPYHISNLTNRVASTANIEYHLRLLQQESLKRSLLTICAKSIQKIQDPSEDIFDVYQNIQVDIDGSLKDVLKYEMSLVKDIHHKIILESIEVAKKGAKSGVATGLKMVDNVTSGWQKSDLIILAGRPGMGKTAAAISFILYPALSQNEPVAIFSLEMSNQQLVSRMQSQISGINVSKIVKKQLTMSEISDLSTQCEILEKAPIYVDDTPNISLLELKGKARKLVRENNVKIIVIDYLQLMRSGMNIMNREQEIAEISRGLKALAKELDIPIIALSQLSRLVESRADKKPQLSDLRESGQIEQDADMVCFCYRPEYYGVDTYEIGSDSFDTRGLFMLIIAKHRNGELGEIPLTFIHELTKITNHRYNDDNNSTFVQQNEQSSSPMTGMPINTSFLQGNNTNEEDLPF